MNMAKPTVAQAGPQPPSEKGGKPPGGGGNAPDDSWRKQSEPHPVTPGKPAPLGPDAEKGAKVTLVSTLEDSRLKLDPRAQTGGPMPMPTLATGSTMVNPYRNPVPPPNTYTGPKSPPTPGAWPWG